MTVYVVWQTVGEYIWDGETMYNRKNPFGPWTPSVDGPFTLRGLKRK